jgi:hypothetical protein
MSDRASLLRWLLVLAACLLLAAASAVAAQADPYGEIQSFGEAEISNPEKAIGVNPENNDVYIVEPGSGQGTFQIEEFGSVGGSYKVIGTAKFKPSDPEGAATPDEVEGVAIDPKLKRIYVLALEKRTAEQPEPDEALETAGSLYAFSSEPSDSGALEPVEGTTGGLLVAPKVLLPQSQKAGVALIEPTGIAVDPKTDDVIILASEDRGLHEGEKETTVVAQRVDSNGALGPRYFDEKCYFTEECYSAISPVGSPVVSSAGRLYVLERDEIIEIPIGETSSSEPVPFVPVPVVQLETESLHEDLTELPEDLEGTGAGLSISPEGTIWSRADIKYQLGGKEHEFAYGGAMEFNEKLEELGWTGGQTLGAQSGECAVDDLGKHQALAAGKDGMLFMLDRSPATGDEGKGPRIIEFGPGGGGCPNAQATLSASAGGQELTEAEPVPIGEKVTLVSKLTQANALSVEWEFEPGVKQTVSTREQESVEIQHEFKTEGLFTVKEIIHTDNLATPTIELGWKIDSVGKPTVVTKAAKVEGTTVTLKGTVDANGQATECHFEYGPTTSYGTEAPCTASVGSELTAKEVSVTLTGLPKHTSYHFRLAAKNHTGEEEGVDETFTTGPAPAVLTEAASSIAQTSATLNAKVNPEGGEVSECVFEYGTSATYGSSLPCATSPKSGEAFVAESVALSGLTANTPYHYRIVAHNSGGTSFGEDQTFTTLRDETSGGGGSEEEAIAAKKHQEEEAAAAAAKKRQEEEAAAAAAKKRQEEEAQKHREEETKTKSKPLTRAQLLANALKTCKKGSKKKRAKCEATARKKYGPKKPKKKKK